MKRTVTSEAFYTTAPLAAQCVAFADKLTPLLSFALIVEPSAGAGAFLRALPAALLSWTVALDTHPAAPGIIQADFMDYHPSHPPSSTLILGNPPFGQRGSLAMAFLKRAILLADTVAFILPRSFKKHTFMRRVDAHCHLLGQFDCDAFELPDGTPRRINCVFQVWQRRSTPRVEETLATTHPDFAMKHFHLSRTTPAARTQAARDYDFAIHQVGSDFSPQEIGALTKGSHWFIKAHAPGVRAAFARLDFAFLDGTNTAHTSLSKADIVRAYAAARE